MPQRFFLRNSVNQGSNCWVLYEAQRRHGEKAKIGRLKGWRLSVVLPHIRRALHASERQKRARSPNQPGNTSANILEEDGVRLTLAFLGTRNLQKLERAETLCQAIQAMSREEAYYWYSKVRSPGGPGIGIRALRTLFCG